MAFEGEHKIIPIKGIVRAGADSIVEDGAMNEVIGFEYKDGSFVPYEPEEKNRQFPDGLVSFYMHKADDVNVIAICKDEDGRYGAYWLSEVEFNRGTTQYNNIAVNMSEVVDVAFVGNIITIVTKDDMAQYLYNRQTKTYDNYASKSLYDVLPQVRFSVSRYTESDSDAIMKGEYNKGNTLYVKSERGDELSMAELADTVNKAKHMLAEEGRLFGYVVAVGAFKRKDGSYIRATPPTLLCAPNAIGVDDDAIYVPKDMISVLNENSTPVYQFRSTEHLGTNENWNYIEPSFSDCNLYRIENSQKIDTVPNSDLRTPSVQAWHCQGKYFASIYGNVLQYDFDFNNAKNTFKDKAKGVIDSFCIFISPEVQYYKDFNESNLGNRKDGSIGTIGFSRWSVDNRIKSEIYKDIDEIQSFYKVHEIFFEDLCSHIEGNYKDVSLKGKLGDNLYLQDTLPISAFDHNIYADGVLKSYNSRIHQANYKKVFYEGYKMQSMSFYQGELTITGGIKGQYRHRGINYDFDYENSDNKEGPIDVDVRVLINGVDGEYEVWQKDTVIDFALNPIVAYPNKDAYKMEVYAHNGLNRRWLATFPLKASKHGGYAYYLGSTSKNIGYINTSIPDEGYQFGYVSVDTQTEFKKNSTVPTYNINNTLHCKNNMRVSNTSFVSIFDYANYYTIGDGEIVGLSTLSQELIQDNFGAHPLLAFCSDGIYAVGVDTSGVGVYRDITPFSREVCINKKSICNIDGNVLFISDKGLMVANSRGVQEYIQTMNGIVRNTPAFPLDIAPENGVGMKWYGEIITKATEMLHMVCASPTNPKDYKKMLKDASTHVSYVASKNKIILYNKDYFYSFLIDIPTRVVTKIGKTILFDNNDYPNELYLSKKITNSNSYKVLDFKIDAPPIDIDVLLQSRPIKLKHGLKASYRVILRGYFHSTVNENSKNLSALLVLGSYDGRYWMPIGFKQKDCDKKGYNDIGCVTDRVSCNYIMVIYTSPLSPESHIEQIEITANNKYNNKLK